MVTIEERPAMLVLSKRAPVRLSEIGEMISTSFGEVYGFMGGHGLAPAGAPLVIYHGDPGTQDPFEVEICAPIEGSPEAQSGHLGNLPAGWRLTELPAGAFATLMHVGSYETLGAAYAKIREWLEAQDVEMTGPPRETYLSEPGTPPDQIRTLIEFPVARVPARTAP